MYTKIRIYVYLFFQITNMCCDVQSLFTSKYKTNGQVTLLPAKPTMPGKPNHRNGPKTILVSPLNKQ